MFKRTLIVYLLSCWSIYSSIANADQSNNILILHSYHPTFQWNVEINQGINRLFLLQPKEFNLMLEYMDSKRIFDQETQINLLKYYKHKYKDVDFDVIILSDDDALQFMLKYGDDLFPGVPVVFCGINNYDPQLMLGYPNYTGVLEKLDKKSTIELALAVFPKTEHIYFVGDHSTTAYDLANIVRENYENSFREIIFHYLHESKISKLTDTLKKLPDNSQVMLFPYLNQGGNLLVESEIATQKISQASNSPVWGFWHFMLNHGIVGGKLVSGHIQGENAADIALRILNGEIPAQIPIREFIPNDYYFDYRAMERFNISTNLLLESGHIINQPFRFFKKYQNILLGFLFAVVIFTFLFIINLIANLRTRKILQKELEFQHELIDALPNPTFYTLDNQIIQDCNKAFEKLTGDTKDHIIGKEIPSIYLPNQTQTHKTINSEVLKTRRSATYEGQITTNNNVLRDVIFYKSALYNKRTKKYGIIETIVDITDKKLAIEKIKSSEERYQLVIRATKDGIWDWNLQKKELFVSARLNEMLNYPAEEAILIHENFDKYIHPDDISIFNYQLELLQQEMKDSFSIEIRIIKKDGSYFWVESKTFALADKNNDIYRLVGSISDIQSRKETEKTLKKSEEIFRNTLMGIATGNPLKEKPGRFNPVFAKMHGYTLDEISNMYFDQFMADEAKADLIPMFEKARENDHHVCESLHVRKDGYVFPVMIDITAVKNNRSELKYFIINIQDITERKKQESKISQMLQNEQAMNEELRSSEEEVRQSLQQTVNLKEKLEENQKQFLSFIDGTSDFALLKDRDLRYVIVNESFARFYNQDPDELIGKTDHDIAPPWLASEEQIIDQSILDKQKPIIYEKEVEGQIFETRKFPVFYENQSIGVGAFIRDITKQRIIEQQVQENELRFKTLLENSFDLITLTDTKGKILYCTDAILKITGYTSKEVIGKQFSLFFHPEDRPVFDNKMEIVLNADKEAVYIQHRMKHAIQGYRNIETIATNHLENSLISALVFTSRDVSLELQSRELKKNIALAQKSAEIKQQFLANMSHEIRTPMNGIVGMIEFLMKTPLNDTQIDYVKTIKSSADSLLNIINDILDFSKIEAGKLSINQSPVHIKKFISDAPKIFAALVKQKNLDFKVFIDESLPEYLNTDPLRLNQVLSNLLSNAIKFTPSGSISLRVFPDKIIHDVVSLKFEIQDSGIGISEEEQESLFKPFMQIDSSLTRSIEGTGLGLTISQRIVELMGGEIGVISKKDHGALFWFTITTSIPEIGKIQKLIEENKNIQVKDLHLNILLVEDKVVNQKVIKLMLESMGCIITIASNGEEAIHLLENVRSRVNKNPESPNFDIILMDIQMPVMDGITATKIIRQRFPEYPVIIGLSANVFSSDVEGFLKSGLDDYILKPAKSVDLYKKLLFWSERSKSRDKSASNEDSYLLISKLEKEKIIEEQSFEIIKTQAENNTMVLNELFKAFYSDAGEFAQNIRNAYINNNNSLNDYVQTLYNMALSMGASQIARTCETIAGNVTNPSIQMETLLKFLDQSIQNYYAEAMKNLG